METNNPVVSVVIPTYNRAHMIVRAINSVLNQTYKDLEIIVVDDASQDNTEVVVKSFDDERIQYFRHDKNRGGSAARNTGIKASRGAYIALLDSDDEWFPEKLEKQVNKFNDTAVEVGAVYCGFQSIIETTGQRIEEHMPTLRGDIAVDLFKGCPFNTSQLLIRKECFQKTGMFDEAFPACQDWDMWIRFSQYFEFDFVPSVLVKRYYHGEQITSSLPRKIQARRKLIEKHHNLLAAHPVRFSQHLNKLGILCCLNGDFKQAKRCFLDSIGKMPAQRFAYLNFLFLLLAPQLHRSRLQRNSSRWAVDGIPLYW